MLTFIENYKAKVREVRKKKEEIEAQLNKKIEKLRRIEDQIYKLKMKKEKLRYPSWVNEIIVLLAQKLAEMKGLSYEIFGPFGLMNETNIFLMKDPSISILEQEVWALTIVPGLFKGVCNS
jgi:predicted nuclease with TOPRIM domain